MAAGARPFQPNTMHSGGNSMNSSKGLLLLIIGLTSFTAGGCGPSEGPEGEPAEPMSQASAVAEADTTGTAIWAHLQQSDYQSTWTLWPGMGELYTGREPHGMLLTTYLNDVALEALNSKASRMAASFAGRFRPLHAGPLFAGGESLRLTTR